MNYNDMKLTGSSIQSWFYFYDLKLKYTNMAIPFVVEHQRKVHSINFLIHRCKTNKIINTRCCAWYLQINRKYNDIGKKFFANAMKNLHPSLTTSVSNWLYIYTLFSDISISYLLWHITYLFKTLGPTLPVDIPFVCECGLPIKEAVRISLALGFKFLHVTCFV